VLHTHPKPPQEEAIIKVVKEASPAVVSVIITKDIPKLKLYYEEPFKEFEEFFGIPFEFKIPQWKQEGYEKQEIGGGTAFFISEDGMLFDQCPCRFRQKCRIHCFNKRWKEISS